eukprot:CAMPEP_0206240162 /NCGR_PEP_ID=MMETSP0047_2-20121206/15788_1 /ASSEMBLY_ACC=CAM_ASM_000192 /TAXON_ID=195065 /ORGANISM="Chroomonas mesostigmatica_cf, Strain CCMP1168" /LENGTH=197 /DNA_ID=CAMNT_0053664919 /DNA_START=846 /DNA_END=1439 /DNA_ORIENTATION=-
MVRVRHRPLVVLTLTRREVRQHARQVVDLLELCLADLAGREGVEVVAVRSCCAACDATSGSLRAVMLVGRDPLLWNDLCADEFEAVELRGHLDCRVLVRWIHDDLLDVPKLDGRAQCAVDCSWPCPGAALCRELVHARRAEASNLECSLVRKARQLVAVNLEPTLCGLVVCLCEAEEFGKPILPRRRRPSSSHAGPT